MFSRCRYVEQEIVGDETTALDSVLQADVWRHKLISEETELNHRLENLLPAKPEDGEGEAVRIEQERDDMTARLGELTKQLMEMEAETGPARAGALLAGLGFNEEDQKKTTKSFSGGWRMRLALARALFVKPDLLMLDEPSNMLDLNAIAWLEDYLQTWQSTLLVVSHDRAFLDAVATDIIHQHSQRLDYYKGNFSQFYATKTDREKNAKKEYEAQLTYRQHLQAFIDRWRYNANRGMCTMLQSTARVMVRRLILAPTRKFTAAQAQSKIKILEKLPELEPPEAEDSETFKYVNAAFSDPAFLRLQCYLELELHRFPDPEKIAPPLLQLNECSFAYVQGKEILHQVSIDVSIDSRITVIGPNGAGKSTL